MPEVGLVLHGEHADELNLELDEVAVVEIDVIYHLDVDVLVLIDEIGVEVLEQHDIPVHNDLPRVRLVLLLVWYLKNMKINQIEYQYRALTPCDLDDLLPLNSFLSLLRMLSKSFLSFMMLRTS